MTLVVSGEINWGLKNWSDWKLKIEKIKKLIVKLTLLKVKFDIQVVKAVCHPWK